MKYKLNQYLLAVILTIFAIGCATTQSESKTPSETITVESSELITAVRNGKTDTVKALLEAGADVNAPSNIYGRPLRIASFYGYTEIVKALVAAGADVNQHDDIGATALMAASLNGYTETIKSLLEAGADVNQHDDIGATALMFASLYGYTETIKSLLEAGADVNQHDDSGETALMATSDKGHTETVKALLAAGADVNMEGNRGETALGFAKKSKHKATVQLLEEAGARKSFERKELMTDSIGFNDDQIVNGDRLRVRIQELHTAMYERDAEKWFSMLDPESKNNYSDLEEFKKDSVYEDEPPWEGKMVSVIDDFCNCVPYKTSDMCTFLVHLTVIDKAGVVQLEARLLDVWLYEDDEWYWFLTYWELVDQCPG